MYKKNFQWVLIIAAMAFIIAACSSQKDKMNNEIADLEKVLRNDSSGQLIVSKGNELSEKYIAFSRANAHDSLAPEYLLRAAKVYMNIHRAEDAVNLLDTLMQKYPSFKNLSECLFLQAFICENSLGQLGRAKDKYFEFLQKYPESEFADDAKAAIELLGKSPEEIVKGFETKKK
ncbi:MAG: hypothetical protein M0R21_00135 [Lentimicrobiaceae bacterium]|nr:hypothetical protein [Lentimicrobiaceae bacterium]